MAKQAARVVNRLPISQARVNLGEVAKRAHVGGEYFILEKNGIPVIGIMDADEFEDYLELRSAQVNRQIAGSNTDIASGRIKPAATVLDKPRSAVRPIATDPGARKNDATGILRLYHQPLRPRVQKACCEATGAARPLRRRIRRIAN